RHADRIDRPGCNGAGPRVGAVRGGQDHNFVHIPVDQAPAAADASHVLRLDDSAYGRTVRVLVVDVGSTPGDGTGTGRHPDDQRDNSEDGYKPRLHTDSSV